MNGGSSRSCLRWTRPGAALTNCSICGWKFLLPEIALVNLLGHARIEKAGLPAFFGG